MGHPLSLQGNRTRTTGKSRISDRKRRSSALKPLAIVLQPGFYISKRPWFRPTPPEFGDRADFSIYLIWIRFCGFGPDFGLPPLPSRESLPRIEKSKVSGRKRCSSALKPLAFVLQPGFYIAKQPWIRPTPSELGGRAEFSIL